jgi:uncharacterized protein (TIGR02588 family)
MKKVKKNRLEWAVFGLSVALVAGTLGFLVYDAVRLEKRPPEIEVRLGAPERRGEEFVVPVSVTNRGDQTAEGVQVEVTLEAGSAEPERGEFTIAFVPRRATREGWVAFKTDPRTGRLTPRVLGYEKP